MPGKRISELTALSGAASANNDDLLIFDSGAGETKRISRSQLAEGMQTDVQVFTNKTIDLGSNTLTGTTAQFNTALSDNDFATQAGSETLTNKTIDSASNTLTVNYKEARVETSDASRTHLFTTVAALLADTGTYTTYAAGQIVEAGGFRYEVAASGASDQHVTTAGGVKLYVLADTGGYNVKAFGAVGDNTADDTLEIQAAVTAACNDEGRLVFPAGGYRISAAITFPNKSFVIEGEGPTSTYIKPLAAATAISIFDFTGCTGPAKVVRGLGFEGPAPSVYGNGAAIKCSGTNGLYLDNIWARGIRNALLVTSSSLINCNQCVAEFCYIACEVTNTLGESIWAGWTFYKNETDISVAGAQKTFTIRDFNAIGTRTDVLVSTGSGLLVDGITVQNDGTAYTPNIVNLTGAYNQINNVSAKDFGSVGVFLQGAGATKNRISNLHIEGLASGIVVSSGSDNYISNFTLKGCTTRGVRVDTANNNVFENFLIEGCAHGVSISANDLTAFYSGKITGSTTADWHQTAVNTGRLIIDNVQSDQTGLAGVGYKMSLLPSGNYLISRASIPSSAYPFTVGDVTINSAPAVGSPKGWRCTVAGSPGTWVSEGNL